MTCLECDTPSPTLSYPPTTSYPLLHAHTLSHPLLPSQVPLLMHVLSLYFPEGACGLLLSFTIDPRGQIMYLLISLKRIFMHIKGTKV